MSVIDTREFYQHLTGEGVELFAGVPDSLLQDLCACIYDLTPREMNVVTANEGNAIGIACGYHVSTGKYAAVYLQNSGLGNIVNPVTSLAHPEVYGVPMLLIIGWRGEPGVKDEPQHVAQGRLTPQMLDSIEVPYTVLAAEDWASQVNAAIGDMRATNRPVALLVRKGLFSPYSFTQENPKPEVTLTREEALSQILGSIGTAFVVSTTGKTSREVFELREARGEGHARDFLTVGGMGHSSSIAMGACLGTEELVYCIDGDGGFLMHMGAGPVIAQRARENFRYVLINNGAHESVGGQPTVAFDIDVAGILRASGFEHVELVADPESIPAAIARMATHPRSALIIETAQGSRPDLGRPTVSPSDNKTAMLEEFQGTRR